MNRKEILAKLNLRNSYIASAKLSALQIFLSSGMDELDALRCIDFAIIPGTIGSGSRKILVEIFYQIDHHREIASQLEEMYICCE